jgi:hypothetical protein
VSRLLFQSLLLVMTSLILTKLSCTGSFSKESGSAVCFSIICQAVQIPSSSGAAVYDEPWPLLRLLSIGPDPVSFVSNF